MPSGSAVTADFRCSTLLTGTPTTRAPSGSRCARSCSNPASFVRPPSPTHTVPACSSTSPPSRVPGSSIRTIRYAELAQRRLGAVGLRLALVRARPRHHREVVQHDHGVLHEHGVGAVGRRSDLDGLPAVLVQRRHVRVPLAARERDVDRRAVQVGQQTVRQTRTGTADQCSLCHAVTLAPGGGPSSGRGAWVDGRPHPVRHRPGRRRHVRHRAAPSCARGRKTSHWMWFVFPQLAGLGRSSTAQHYAIADLAEARAYLDHPVLGPRLVECAETLTALPGSDPEAVLGGVDAMKLRSSMTLFAAAATDPEQPARSAPSWTGTSTARTTRRPCGFSGRRSVRDRRASPGRTAPAARPPSAPGPPPSARR